MQEKQTPLAVLAGMPVFSLTKVSHWGTLLSSGECRELTISAPIEEIETCGAGVAQSTVAVKLLDAISKNQEVMLVDAVAQWSNLLAPALQGKCCCLLNDGHLSDRCGHESSDYG